MSDFAAVAITLIINASIVAIVWLGTRAYKGDEKGQ